MQASVTAIQGFLPYTFEWRRDEDSVSTVPTLALENVTADAGTYTCAVSDKYSSIDIGVVLTLTIIAGLPAQSADVDHNNAISLSELLRAIQFYNVGALHCEEGTEDGYAPGAGDSGCAPHTTDYNPQDWSIGLSELLRLIQFYNALGYYACPDQETEDGDCPGPAPATEGEGAPEGEGATEGAPEGAPEGAI